MLAELFDCTVYAPSYVAMLFNLAAAAAASSRRRWVGGTVKALAILAFLIDLVENLCAFGMLRMYGNRDALLLGVVSRAAVAQVHSTMCCCKFSVFVTCLSICTGSSVFPAAEKEKRS